MIRARRHIGVLAAALLALTGTAQGKSACQLLQVAELQVTMLGNLPLIKASINGRGVLLLADTGDSSSLILRPAAKALNLSVTASNTRFYGAGGADTAGVVVVHDFALAGISAHNVRLYATGRGALPGDAVGILGEDVLSRWDAEFDLSAGRIRLFKPRDCDGDQVVYWASAYFMMDLVTIARTPNLLEANVLLNGRPVLAMFDTGAALSTVTFRALQRTGIKAETPLAAAEASYGIANRQINTAIAVFPSLSIGQESIENAKLRIADLFSMNTEVRTGSYIPRNVFEDPDMVIGADFFMAHRVYVARSQKKIYFTYKGGPIFQHVTPPADAAPGDTRNTIHQPD